MKDKKKERNGTIKKKKKKKKRKEKSRNYQVVKSPTLIGRRGKQNGVVPAANDACHGASKREKK